MLYLVFSPEYSLEKCITMYNDFLKGKAIFYLWNALGISSSIQKNGKRKKCFLYHGKKYYLQIQRYVSNHNYFDLFPLFLLPNSMIPIQDRNNETKTMFHHWEEKYQIDLFKQIGFIPIKKYMDYVIFMSREKILPYLTNKGSKKKLYEKKNIFLVII